MILAEISNNKNNLIYRNMNFLNLRKNQHKNKYQKWKSMKKKCKRKKMAQITQIILLQ